MAILSANSRRGPTTIESSPTSSASHPIVEPPPTIDFEGGSADDESKSPCIVSGNPTAEGKNGRGSFLDTRETNVYSFCYKTEMNILPEETEAHTPMDDEIAFSNGSSLKTEPTTEDSVDVSCSPGNESGEVIPETDTPKEATESSRPEEPVARPMERIEEEEAEIATRIVEERVSSLKREGTPSIERSLIDFGDDARPKSISGIEEIDFSKSCKRESSAWSVVDEDEDEDEEKEEKGDIVTEIEKELKEKMDQEGGSASSQRVRRVFRGDSRDSGIGDCASNLSTSSQQVNELGISAIKEEEADNESNNNNNKGLLEKLERFEDRGTLLVDDIGEITAGVGCVKVSDPKRHTKNKGGIEVAALSGVNKASREINRQHEGVFFNVQCSFPFFSFVFFFFDSITFDQRIKEALRSACVFFSVRRDWGPEVINRKNS